MIEEVYNKLTETDKTLIENYISWFGPNNIYNMDWSNWAGIKTVLTEWSVAKSYSLFKMFGEELILRRPYTYKYNVDCLAKEIAIAHEAQEYKDFNNWWNWSIKHNGNVRFEIIDNNDQNMISFYYSKYFYIEQAFCDTALAKNAYEGEDFKIKFEDDSVFKVTSGMKPMKILHKFIEKFGNKDDEEMFERFRIWHSQLLNQKAMDGELCLSIHPLDYITMSDNANNWNSCMRWTDKHGHPDPGDYRAGTVDCMNSPYIIIAYLHNPKHTFKLNDGWEWNSKRWRELFIVNEGSITEIKGYPYQDENLTNACLMWIKEIAKKNLNWEYDNEEINMKDHYEEDGIAIYFDFIKSQYMYKDIGSLQKHAGRINKKLILSKGKPFNPDAEIKSYFFDIPYGGISTCMCCGRERDEDEGDKSVFCGRCDSISSCACCGAPLYNDDDIYWIDEYDEPYCYSCWSEQTTVDDLSEESHAIENMTEISLLVGYDSSERPIWYTGKTLMVYEPSNNWCYQKMFTEPPKRMDMSIYGCKYYVTLDMIRPDKYHECMQVFENPDEEDLYPDDLYYFSDMTLVYPEEEEE